MKKHILAIAVLALSLAASAQPAEGSFEQTWKKGPSWLENAVIYQIYPSSFKDSDGNGIGDIKGVRSEMDYIGKLGVDVIWFNPLFASGWIDGGYDILDYYKVDPRFGTNTDLVNLIKEAHSRGIKVFLDLVPGHTSMDHPWFKQSMEADPNQQYSDYYIWSDSLPDKKAEETLKKMMASENPLQDTRGKWMEANSPRAKYYMKNFYACQPSLNFGFANPDPNHPWEQGVNEPGPQAVRRELKNIIAFWFDKGVDGFRVDMASSLVKNDKDKTEIVRLWREMRTWMDANYPDHVLMAEWNDPEYCLAAGFNIDMDLNSQKAANRRMYFDFKHQADGGSYFSLNGGAPSTRDLYGNPWPEDQVDKTTTPEMMLRKYYERYQKVTQATRNMGYFATITGNHDHLRFNTGSRNDPEQLKVMMAFVMTMPLPILYYGDEIGLRSLADLPNVEGANHNGKERAGGRTPMQWNSSENAGFSTCAPENLYLPICPEWTPATSYPLYLKWKEEGAKNPTAKGAITVESQDQDPESLLNWTRSMIELRKCHKAFWASSRWEPVITEGAAYPMVYVRSDEDASYMIVLNPTGTKQSVVLAPQTEKPVGTKLNAEKSLGKVEYKVTKKGDQLTMGPTSVMIVKIR